MFPELVSQEREREEKRKVQRQLKEESRVNPGGEVTGNEGAGIQVTDAMGQMDSNHTVIILIF